MIHRGAREFNVQVSAINKDRPLINTAERRLKNVLRMIFSGRLS